MKTLEQVCQFVLRDTRAGVANGEFGNTLSAPEGDFDFALERKLEGIGEQVEYDLLTPESA
jgi:hypothetical protein